MTKHDSVKPLAASAPTHQHLPRQELVDLLREMSLSFATDARRVGAPGSDVRACYAVRSLACEQAARLIAFESQKYPTWAFTAMVDALINQECRTPTDPCGGSDCITEYCAPCFARAWNETYPT